LPTAALVTDIGNDLLYGATPDRLLGWVEGCLDRLAEVGAETIVTHLPASSIDALGERRFHFFRRVLFSRSTLTLAEAKQLVCEINERLTVIGQSRNLSVIPVSAAWYGLDPIHIRRRAEREAWPTMLGGWRSTSDEFNLRRTGLFLIAYLASLAPLERSQFGFELRTAQPCGRFSDGSTVSLY
jgi:hypothetical protein